MPPQQSNLTLRRLLWITWFITSIFDARFGQDGVVERFARAFHLTVMVGFAVVSVSFNSEKLVRPIFKAGCELLQETSMGLISQADCCYQLSF
jgi:hypothetical protein